MGIPGPDWSSLPISILAEITKGLNTESDTLRFRAVCKSFQSSASLPPEDPLRIPFPRPVTSHFGHLILTESTIYAFEPLQQISNTNETTKTLLVKLEKSNSGKMRIKEPLSRFRFRKLANMLPKSLNLLDYKVKEITKAYGLEFFAVVKELNDHDIELGNLEAAPFHKVVASACFDESDEEFSVMATYGFVHLGLWRRGNKNWINIEFGNIGWFRVEDVIYHNQKFYALDLSGLTITVDPYSLTASFVAAPLPDSTVGFKYLVNSLNHLFLIVKTHLEDFHEIGNQENYPIRMDVFKLDEVNHEWIQVKGLEDRVFFVGDDCSFSVSAEEFPGFKRNCIYFNDDVFAEASDDHPGWYPGIFDLENNSVAPLAAFPGYSKIFWPAPSWLKKNSISTPR